jgi:peptidyl-prolyl cis-trans isomerase C
MAPEHGPARSRRSAFVACAARNGALAVVLVCVACRSPGSTAPQKAVATAAPSAVTGADGSPVLAELDGHVITLQGFDERLSRQPLALRARFRDVEARRRLLDDMVQLDLLADEARRRGIDRLPEIRDRVSELLAEELTREVFATDAKSTDVSDAEVKAYYDTHAAEFRVPEERKAIALVLERRDQADEALQKVAAHPGDEAFFRGLVRDTGRGPASAPRVFDSGFVTKMTAGGLPAAARDALFDVRAVGDVHPVVVSDGVFYVLMLTGIRPALVREPKDVAPLVRERLREERRSRAVADFVDTLRARGHVHVHPERLGPAAAPGPAASASARSERTD